MSGWKAYFLVLLVTLPAWIGFFPANMGFPLDDSWVVTVFVRNLSESGSWEFNQGEPCVGGPSPAWTWLLSLFPGESAPSFYRQVLATQALSILLALYPLAWALPTMFKNCLDGTGRFRGFGATLLAVLTLSHGVWLFHLFSGLETCVFVSAGVLALVLNGMDRKWMAAAALSFLILLRPEGYLLAVVLIGHSLLTGQGAGLSVQGLWKVVRSPLSWGAHLAVGWVLLHNWRVSGSHLFDALAGRRFQFHLDPDRVDWENFGAHSLAYVAEWIKRLHEWYWMNDYLPSWGVLALPGGQSINALAIILNLFMVAGALAVAIQLFRPEGWGKRSTLSLLAVWTFLHNLGYLFLLPVGGQAGRFQALNYLWPPILVAIGAQELASLLSRLGAGLRPHFIRSSISQWGTILPICLMTVPWLISQGVWNEVLTAGIDRINGLHQLAGIWSKEYLPPDSRVVASEPGAYKMASGLSITHPSGLLGGQVQTGRINDNTLESYRGRGATHLFQILAREEPDPVVDPVSTLPLEEVFRTELPDEIGIDLKACQNKGSRCAIYRIVYSEE